jgi:hypothetical protein
MKQSAVPCLVSRYQLGPTAVGHPLRRKAVTFHNPQAFSNVQEENHSCARDQVVIARPPVLTPP